MRKYTIDEIKEIVEKENIKYIRLQFTDMDGFLKNVEIPSYRLVFFQFCNKDPARSSSY